ncbi:MAG: TetR/AcrR family transcriptional regulator [Firmicutes bacterium]|jgi:AcrR family transcriptional regulator|nr:TetR/AcrR family transcriptional regulator [Bacillota bacterium]
MKKKNSRNTKGKIVSAAWKLFYDQGYNDTTIDEIIELSGTSRGSFYHYFEGKDALLSSLSYLFDEKYQELIETMDENLSPVDKLIYINHELFLMIDNTVSVELLSQLFATQLTTKGEKHLMNPGRTYYKLVRQIAAEGLADGTFRNTLSVGDITRAYAMFERGLMYDWCLSSGSYSLCQYGQTMLPLFLSSFCHHVLQPHAPLHQSKTDGALD